jgi:HEAT repeat protein
MNADQGTSHDLRSLIADHMEAGFLENIIDMFRHDSSLYRLVGELIQDERVRVRIGVTAMMEELKVRDGDNISRAVAPLLPLLDHEEDFVRGDAVNLLGISGDRRIIPHLQKALLDKDPNVRIIAEEAIEEILNES